MFLQQKQYHDLSCQVDIGQMKIIRPPEIPYEKEPYYKTDLDFIESLIHRIKY